jgi:hypothetical protein
MKRGLELQDLAKEVQRQETIKKDYIADTNGLEAFTNAENEVAIRRKTEVYDTIGSTLTNNAHTQVASRLKIPKQYYDRLLSKYPDLLALNINNFLTQEPEKRMIRLLDGKIRAFLSDKYRVIDNWETMSALLPVLLERTDAKLESCDVTENRMYLKVILHEMTGELATGDIVKSGVVISNSETGNGSFRVEPFTMVLYCSNGMISNRSVKKYHVGKKQGEDVTWEVLSENTKNLTNKAFFEQMKDVVRASFTDVDFQMRIDEINDAQTHKVSPKKLEGTIKAVTKKYGITDSLGDNLLEQLIEGKEGLTLWGLAQSLTAVSQKDEIDYEMATTMERAAGSLVEMGGSSFDSMIKQLSK